MTTVRITKNSGCQRRLESDPLFILIAEVNLTYPGTLCCSGSATQGGARSG